MIGSAIELDGDSTAEIVRSELVQAFTRLDNDTVLLTDEEPVEISITSSPTKKDALQSLPATFESFEEARTRWEVILSQMLHWIASAYVWGSRKTDESKARAAPLQPPQHRAPLPPSYLISFADQRQTYLAGFRRRRAAFRPLLARSRTPGGSAYFAAATALELRRKSTYTTLIADHFLGETCCDAHVDDFHEGVELAEALVALESRSGGAGKAK